MTSFIVKSRSTTAWKEETIEAETREEAIQQVIDAGAEGDEVEVSNVTEAEVTEEAPIAKKTAATSASAPASSTSASAASRQTK